MDIEDVDITLGEGGYLVAVHRACGAVVEQFSLSVGLATILADVEGSDHECDSVPS